MIADGEYTLWSGIIQNGKNGVAVFPMIVEGGQAKAIVEKTPDGAPAKFVLLDQHALQKTRPSNFEADYVYQKQIDMDSALSAHTDGEQPG